MKCLLSSKISSRNSPIRWFNGKRTYGDCEAVRTLVTLTRRDMVGTEAMWGVRGDDEEYYWEEESSWGYHYYSQICEREAIHAVT